MRWKSNDNLLNRFGLTGFKMEQTLLVKGKIKAKIKKIILRLHVGTGLTIFTLRQLLFCPLILN